VVLVLLSLSQLFYQAKRKKEKKGERETKERLREMGKIGKKKNKKNNGRFGGTNCVPILLPRHAASTKSGPVRPEIASIELGFKGASTVPVFLVLNLAAGIRSSRVSIVCRWSCSKIGGAMYVIHADDALDSLIADVNSRGGLLLLLLLPIVSSRQVQSGIVEANSCYVFLLDLSPFRNCRVFCSRVRYHIV
jgi:hypothetical protein